MVPIIRIQLWRDPETGREHVKKLIESFGPERTLSVMKTINETHSGSWLEDLLRDQTLEPVEECPDLYILKVKKKRYEIHFFACVRGGILVLVHAVEKEKLKPIHTTHYETAKERIKKVI